MNGNTIPGDTSFAADFNGELTSGLSYYEGVVVGNEYGNFNLGTVTLDAEYTSQTGDKLVLVSEDGFLDTLSIKGGTAGTTVELLDSPTRAINADYETVYLIYGAVAPTEWRVINVTETDEMQYEVTALQHDATKYAAIEEGLVIDPPRTSFFPTGPLSAPTELDITESLYIASNKIRVRIDISWIRSADPRVALYRVEVQPPDANWQTLSVSSMTQAQVLDAREGFWSFRVRAIMGSNITLESQALESLNYEIFGKTLPPSDVANFTATRDYASVLLSWDTVTDIDAIGYTIVEGEDWSSGTVIVDTIMATSFTAVLEDTRDTTYLIRAVDVAGNLSVNVSRVETVARTVPTVTNFLAYQAGRDVILTWDHIRRIAAIKYETRYSPVGTSWEESQGFETTETPQIRKRYSVNASGTTRFHIKPFVELDNGSRIYGAESTFDREIHPVIGNAPTKTQAEHPGWSGTYGAAMEKTAANEMALKTDKTFGTYVLQFNHASPVFGALWYEATWLFLSATELEVFDATMDVFDATFYVTPEINAEGVPQIAASIQLDGVGDYIPFVEADYQFTTSKLKFTFTRNATDPYRPALSALTVYQNVPTFML